MEYKGNNVAQKIRFKKFLNNLSVQITNLRCNKNRIFCFVFGYNWQDYMRKEMKKIYIGNFWLGCVSML